VPCLNRSLRRACKQGQKPCRTRGLCFNSQVVNVPSPRRRPRKPLLLALLLVLAILLFVLSLLASAGYFTPH
jgi:hypothetical protein